MLCGIAPACATKAPPTPAPQTVVVRVKDRPPSDLLVCPVKIRRPAATAGGVLPEDKRRQLGDLARAYDQVVDQLTRLIAWSDPAACGGVSPAPARAGPPAGH